MSAAVGPVRAGLAPPRAAGGTAATLVLLALAAIAGAVAAVAPGLLRLLFAGAFALVLLTLCLSRPRAGLVATIGFLTALALIRRLLIADAGWASLDPLLLVGPLVAAALCARIFLMEGRPIAPDLLSKLVMAVLVITGLQIFNPAGGSLLAGLVGFLFFGVPLLWFFVGRELVDDRLADAMMGFVVALAVVVGLYGLSQTQIGFPSWDRAWIDLASGYTALNVGDQIRAFGTFSSSAEYSLFLGTAIAFAAALVLRGRPQWGLTIPILAVALFLSSTRSAFILTGLAIAVLAALRPRRPVLAVAVAVVALAVAYGSASVLGSTLSSSGNALVQHQVSGLTDPLNSSDSTLVLHVQMFLAGLNFGLSHPLGVGVGVIGAAAKLNSGNLGGSTEIDVSNAFVSSGLVGGLLYVVLLAVAALRGIQGWFAGRDTLLGTIGIMVSTAGQWLMGGHYLLAPLTWILIGNLARVTADLPSRHEAVTVQARAASPLPSPAT